MGRDFILTDLCHYFRRRLMSFATLTRDEEHTRASSFSGKCATRKWAFEDAYPRIHATNVCDSCNPYRGSCRRWVIILESLHSFRIALIISTKFVLIIVNNMNYDITIIWIKWININCKQKWNSWRDITISEFCTIKNYYLRLFRLFCRILSYS